MLLVVALLVAPSEAGAQASKVAPAPGPPGPVAAFANKVGPNPSSDQFRAAAREFLWDVYPQDSSFEEQLVAYVEKGPDGPALAFAGLALIGFHDPATVKPLLRRASDRNLSETTRWSFLNTAPYILSMGDVFYVEEGKLDAEARQMIEELTAFADKASARGLGRLHAAALREIHDVGQSHPDVTKESDYWLTLWHVSAYLLGTLDLRDRETLEVFLDPEYGNTFANVSDAPSYSTNREFLADLRGKKDNEITPEAEKATANAARKWWRDYLDTHPDGDWLDAVLSRFQESGYRLEDDLRSPVTTRELVRALDSGDEIMRFNAYRLLNRIYGTHFDLERIFFSEKYAPSFMDPGSERETNEKKLKDYWERRLSAK